MSQLFHQSLARDQDEPGRDVAGGRGFAAIGDL